MNVLAGASLSDTGLVSPGTSAARLKAASPNFTDAKNKLLADARFAGGEFFVQTIDINDRKFQTVGVIHAKKPWYRGYATHEWDGAPQVEVWLVWDMDENCELDELDPDFETVILQAEKLAMER